MQLFGRGRRAQKPQSDVDLAERLESVTVGHASPAEPDIPDVDEPEARSVAPSGELADEPVVASTQPGDLAAGGVRASSAIPSEPEAGSSSAARLSLGAGPLTHAEPVAAATPAAGDLASSAAASAEPATPAGTGGVPESPKAHDEASMPPAEALVTSREASAARAEIELPAPEPHVDRLTDLLGPAIFERLVAAESARERRYRRPATLVLAELAGLHDLVRAWGVDVGLQAVTSLAAVLRATSRTSDYVARIAADRFAIILTETDEIAAINYVDRVREAWGEEQAIVVGALRVGIGWAGTPGHATLADARPAAEKILRDDLR